jgi:hypothetical protein
MHAEVLPPAQQACLAGLGPAAIALGFHLAGGTAVALHLGHRRSVDFDWFTQSFPVAAVELAEEFRGRGVTIDVSSVADRTLHGVVSGVRTTFLEFRPGLIAPLVPWPEYGCRLASLEDLAALKLLAVAQRGTRKDFFDVHALGARFELAEMLEFYRRKFAVADVGRVVAGLAYFDDAESDPQPSMLVSTSWDDVKDQLRDRVRRFAHG